MIVDIGRIWYDIWTKFGQHKLLMECSTHHARLPTSGEFSQQSPQMQPGLTLLWGTVFAVSLYLNMGDWLGLGTVTPNAHAHALHALRLVIKVVFCLDVGIAAVLTTKDCSAPTCGIHIIWCNWCIKFYKTYFSTSVNCFSIYKICDFFRSNKFTLSTFKIIQFAVFHSCHFHFHCKGPYAKLSRFFIQWWKWVCFFPKGALMEPFRQLIFTERGLVTHFPIVQCCRPSKY